MTKTEKELLQNTHDVVIKLNTLIIGNGVEGIAKKVQRHEKLYYATFAILGLINIGLGILHFFG